MPSLVLLFLLSLAAASTTPDSRALKTTKTTPLSANSTAAVKAPVTVAEKVSLSAPPAEMPPEAAALVAKLRAQIFGLAMQSETDAPFRAVFWASDKATLAPAEIALLAEIKGDVRVEIVTVEKFFANAVTIEDWMKDDEKATAVKFQKLIETLKAELENPQVYLIGKTERTVVVVGKIKGGFGGVITLVVET